MMNVLPVIRQMLYSNQVVINALLAVGVLAVLPSNNKKVCCICDEPIDRNKYFCSIACYTRYRLGIGVDYTKVFCIYPRPPKVSRGFIDYSKEYYCRSCQLRVLQTECDKFRCPKCGRRIHTRKKNKLRSITAAVDNRIRIDAPRVS